MNAKVISCKEKGKMGVLAILLVVFFVIPACASVVDDEIVSHQDDVLSIEPEDDILSIEPEDDVLASIEPYVGTSFDTGLEISECGDNMISATAIACFEEFLENIAGSDTDHNLDECEQDSLEADEAIG